MNSESQPIFDLEYALGVFDDEAEVLQSVIEAFFEETPKELGRLEQALASADLEGVERYSHRMAGSAGMIGATRFRSMAREIEGVAKGGALDGVETMTTRLQTEFAAFLELARGLDWSSVGKASKP